MADWPANGDTDWNTKMKANINVGHDSDGTHTKSQMLTDMGWLPTTATGAADGEVSLTLPNGYIVKMGTKSGQAAGDRTITYTTEGLSAFPTATIQAIAWNGNATSNVDTVISTHTLTSTGFTANITNQTVILRWIAIGR